MATIKISMLGRIAGAYLSPQYIGLLGIVPTSIGIHKYSELFLRWFRVVNYQEDEVEEEEDEEALLERQLDHELKGRDGGGSSSINSGGTDLPNHSQASIYI